MEVDVSDYAIGRVLSMEYKDRKQRSIPYLLKETEKIYEIYDKEMLAVIRELENQRHLLKGIKFKFEV